VATLEPHANRPVLVTGATGFVGRVLCARLAELGYPVRQAVRQPLAAQESAPFNTVVTGDLGPDTDWSQALTGISVVFHLAARTHVLHETSRDPFADYQRVNVGGTHALALAAISAGVSRMVFLSSIKVNGERTDRHPYAEDTPPLPEDAYGISKWEAEQALSGVTRDTGLETVILRPPLVYGPGVKANFLRMMHWIRRGIPLPLASVANRRSLIGVDNLVDALIVAGISPAAPGKTYLVSDDEVVSTPALVRSIAVAMQVKPHLLPCPPALLRTGAAVVGKRGEVRRLVGSLEIDSSRIRSELKWSPRFDLAQGLAQTAQWYYSQFPEKSNT
jgi:nucleoside-diphosphate-sugar epimerase